MTNLTFSDSTHMHACRHLFVHSQFEIKFSKKKNFFCLEKKKRFRSNKSADIVVHTYATKVDLNVCCCCNAAFFIIFGTLNTSNNSICSKKRQQVPQYFFLLLKFFGFGFQFKKIKKKILLILIFYKKKSLTKYYGNYAT